MTVEVRKSTVRHLGHCIACSRYDEKGNATYKEVYEICLGKTNMVAIRLCMSCAVELKKKIG
ncbi:MAG: hypothetical protein NUV74_02065 [Candidatus Brocadiaceae bacterium]|nr:hypothetical protein [Candidatus Brocadiaceae bacterium]